MKNNTQQVDKPSLRYILQNDDLCLSRNPRGTDKGDKKSYIDKFYERHFAVYRDQPIKLMEIGFRHGASLALWSKYFTKGSILGVDNFSDVVVGEDLPVVEEWVKRLNIQISVGDAYSKFFADKISDQFDIIIDDGPHWLATQQIALELYLPKLKPTGIFVVEDILIGGLAIFPLLKKVPAGFYVYFYDFRWHKVCGDNCLFVVKPNNSSIGWRLNRGVIILLGVLYAITEGPLRLLKKLLKG
jgi:SAM-dependent methyltransferase